MNWAAEKYRMRLGRTPRRCQNFYRIEKIYDPAATKPNGENNSLSLSHTYIILSVFFLVKVVNPELKKEITFNNCNILIVKTIKLTKT